MAPLPVEVLYLIFLQLVQQDQLECMTVCRQWHDIIHDYTLFRFIYIDHQQQLDQLIERVKLDPFLGAKVEQLTLQLEFTSPYNSDSIIELFPNLRNFVIISTNQMTYAKSIDPVQNHPWCERIESMVELDDRLGPALLDSGLCKNLTYITIFGILDTPGDYVIKSLVNAPALKMLHLCAYTLTFQDLEFLHEMLPALETLFLYEIFFDRDSFPLDVKPATSIKNFRCVESHLYSSNQLNPHLKYISQKYTHLEELSLKLDQLSPTDDEDDYLYEHVDDYFEDEDIDEIEALEQYKARLTSYMTTLAPYLKTLTLRAFVWKDEHFVPFDFNILDECGCQIKTLVLNSFTGFPTLLNLSITNQAHYIQSLTISNLNGIQNSIMPLKWLRQFTALKELNIKHFMIDGTPPRIILNLADLLENLIEHRLERLGLRGLKLELTDSCKLYTLPSLKELALRNVSFPVGTDIFLSRAFPNLKHLKLDNSFNKQEVFTLPYSDLSYLKIINRSATENSPIMLITLDNNQRRLYNASTKKAFGNYRMNLKKEMFPPPLCFFKAF